MITYPVYFVNGYKFHTLERGATRSTMNSGVCIKGSNYSESSSDFYGRLIEVIQLEYPALPIKRTVLFKCEWFDPVANVGMKIHKNYNLVDINHKRRFNKNEPFILAMQACQVYYTPYPSLKRDKSDWWAVCKVKSRPFIGAPTTDLAFQEDDITDSPISPVVEVDIAGPLNDPTGMLVHMLEDEEGQPSGNEDEFDFYSESNDEDEDEDDGVDEEDA